MTAPVYRAPMLFSKPLAAIDAGDVDEFVRQQLPESDTLELKERWPRPGRRATLSRGAAQMVA